MVPALALAVLNVAPVYAAEDVDPFSPFAETASTPQ